MRGLTNKGERIFWTFDAQDAGKDKPEAVISLLIRDPAAKAELGRKELKLKWKDAVTVEAAAP